MSSAKSYKQAKKSVELQKQAILDLEAVVKSIERGEKMITDLKREIETVNATHQNRASTREDIAYLEDVLKCARKKLAWEKQMSSLQTRAPAVLEKVSALVNDPVNPPADETRMAMLRLLQGVQAAMQRLEQAKS